MDLLENNNFNIESNRYNKSIILQSIPSLLISLVGLSLTGTYLDSALKRDFSQYYPLLLVSSCILSFKSNIELIFAMHLSSMSNSLHNTLNKYSRYAFDNACLVISQSIIIGITVGLVGSSKSLISHGINYKHLLTIMTSCLVTCVFSTLIIILFLIPAIALSRKLHINPDNIILPTISSFGDYFDVICLIFFIERFNQAAPIDCLISLFFIISVFPIPIYIISISKKLIPLQSIGILFATYGLSTISGTIIQFFSTKHPILAFSSPVFCGLSSSTSYIYLNRKVTSIQNNTPHNKKQSFLTLIFIAFIISTLYVAFSQFLFVKFSYLFSILFVILFVLDVWVLLNMIECLLKYFSESERDAGVFTLPLLSSSSDFLGTLSLIGIVNVIALLK